jgi:hypothetical protein
MEAKGWAIVARGRAIEAGSQRGGEERARQIRKDAAAYDAEIYRLYDACANDDWLESDKHAWIGRRLKVEKNVVKRPRTIRYRLSLRHKRI